MANRTGPDERFKTNSASEIARISPKRVFFPVCTVRMAPEALRSKARLAPSLPAIPINVSRAICKTSGLVAAATTVWGTPEGSGAVLSWVIFAFLRAGGVDPHLVAAFAASRL